MLRSLGHSGKYPHAVIADHAGDIYYALKDYRRAERFWRLALKIYDPDLDRKAVKAKISALNSVKR
jgi:predicted negative regulator of RcsB-dependent stress response